VLEDVSNGRLADIEAKLITNLAKWGPPLFSSCSDDVTSVGSRQLRWTPSALPIFSGTMFLVLIPNVTYRGFCDIPASGGFCNTFLGF